MSADNGIYIAEFADGFRVAHAQGMSELDQLAPGSVERQEFLRQSFMESPLYASEQAALDAAFEMSKGLAFLEYGICLLGPVGVDRAYTERRRAYAPRSRGEGRT